MTDIKNTENLLSQVHTISESYKRVSEATGDNFNIFSVLGIEHYEVSTHSLFLAEMLNPKGTHAFNDDFLKLFIQELNLENEFKTKNANIFVEYFIGNIDNVAKTGGRIDILIEDEEKNRIVIENKIYAGEQANQLERYYNFDKKATILFLTRFIEQSINHNDFDKYNSISYENQITKWLEKCQQKAVENPVVRETIKQYKNLVKKLTNQNINSKMNKEISDLIIKNKDSFETWQLLYNQTNNIKNNFIENNLPLILDEIKQEFDSEDIIINFNLDSIKKGNKYLPLIYVNSNLLFDNGISILFQFQNDNHNTLIGGFIFNEKNKFKLEDLHIFNEFKNVFKGLPCKNSNQWLAYFDYHYFMNWTNNQNDLKNLIFGNFKEDLKNKIKKLLNIVNQA